MIELEKHILDKVRETMLQPTDFIYMEGLSNARALTVGTLFQLLHAPPNSLTGSIYKKKDAYKKADEVSTAVLAGTLVKEDLIISSSQFDFSKGAEKKYSVHTADRYCIHNGISLHESSHLNRQILLPDDENEPVNSGLISQLEFYTFPVYSVEKVEDEMIYDIKRNITYNAFERFMSNFNYVGEFDIVVPYYSGGKMAYETVRTDYFNVVLDLINIYMKSDYPFNMLVLPSSASILSHRVTLDELKNNLSSSLIKNAQVHLIKYSLIDNKDLTYMDGSATTIIQNIYYFVGEEVQNRDVIYSSDSTVIIHELKPVDHERELVFTSGEFHTALNMISLYAPSSLTEMTTRLNKL